MLLDTWQTAAKYDSRKHQFRCRCCSKIIESGTDAIFARVNGRRARAIHAACGDVRHSESYTWREVMEHWANR